MIKKLTVTALEETSAYFAWWAGWLYIVSDELSITARERIQHLQ